MLAKTLALPTFDLSGVVAQLKADPVYADWPAEKLQQAEMEYRQFLAIRKAYPDGTIMPTELADTVWHRHILNTRAYFADTANFLGEYLHHRPHMPADSTVKRSYALYRQHFGPMQGSEPVMCDVDDGPVVMCDVDDSRREISTALSER